MSNFLGPSRFPQDMADAIATVFPTFAAYFFGEEDALPRELRRYYDLGRDGIKRPGPAGSKAWMAWSAGRARDVLEERRRAATRPAPQPPAVRVRRNRFDVRHEYLQADGQWKQARCEDAGFCRECIRDGERKPDETILEAAYDGVTPEEAVRIIVGAHLHIPTALVDDAAVLSMTAFTRLRVAKAIEGAAFVQITDEAILGSVTVGDMIALATDQDEQETL